jgi:hypothetical protein
MRTHRWAGSRNKGKLISMQGQICFALCPRILNFLCPQPPLIFNSLTIQHCIQLPSRLYTANNSKPGSNPSIHLLFIHNPLTFLKHLRTQRRKLMRDIKNSRYPLYVLCNATATITTILALASHQNTTAAQVAYGLQHPNNLSPLAYIRYYS